MSGLFITIEGGDGVGKSTQMELLARRLRSLGVTVLTTREPGGTRIGDRIRGLLLDPESVMTARTELFLYEASRAELTDEVIAPALERGEVVICDRFYDSTTAYQAFGRGLDIAMVRSLNLAATDGLVPDITILLSFELSVAMDRATKEGADRLEAQSFAFHQRVIDGFAALADHDPVRFIVVEASGTPDEVAEAVWAELVTHPAFLGALRGADLS